jgi:hypothetical protein
MVVGVEGQETKDYAYPVREMLYDTEQYEKQLRKIRKAVRKDRGGLSGGEYLYGFRKSDRLKPVVTFLLYTGEEPWDKPLTLWDMLDFTDIPPSLAELVPNYRINVIDIRRLKNTDVFQTDVKEVFDYIRYSKDKEKLGKLVTENEYFQHMDEDAFDLVSSYLDADSIEIEKEDYRVEGGLNMCTAIKEMIEDGRLEGRQEGRLEGRLEGRQEGRLEGKIMIYANEMHLNAEEIALKMELDAETVKRIMEETKDK